MNGMIGSSGTWRPWGPMVMVAGLFGSPGWGGNYGGNTAREGWRGGVKTRVAKLPTRNPI
jgi:hypothetical protein